MRRDIWTLPPMPYVSAASEPRALPWPESGWVQGEPESDPCLRASLERAVGARTSQQIGEGKSSGGPAQGAQMRGSRFGFEMSP